MHSSQQGQWPQITRDLGNNQVYGIFVLCLDLVVLCILYTSIHYTYVLNDSLADDSGTFDPLRHKI